ncbi:hypothetical protein [Brevibacillus dissolubilis]|uniref:hypothetical protein n=1 Tax=Brevibacillus dissolubilis TaxID=1844116 RepID=UPI001115D31C|nr:hypothetical protein [Brevibacillus dissolubilis]
MPIPFRLNHNEIMVAGKILHFPHIIYSVREMDDRLVILTLPPTGISIGADEINNVYGISQQGQLLWRIEDAGLLYGLPNPVTYLAIWINDSGKLIATNFALNVVIKPATGKIVERGLTK